MINKKINLVLLGVIIPFVIVSCGGGSSTSNNSSKKDYSQSGYSEESIPQNVSDAIDSPKTANLTQDLKDSITYMYNEEKLAKDVYLNVYKIQPIKQLYNISSKSEIKHEEAVVDLAVKYDLNITLYPDTEAPFNQNDIDSYASGKYPVVAIQELYDMLYDKGIQSSKDAFEVGCMVEVTDINDLDRYMGYARESNASDILDVFDFLREGSYKHYWAFDDGLKNLGVSNGCCSLGDRYCHTEYPKN